MAEPTLEPVSWLAIQAIVGMLAPIAREDGWHTDIGSSAIHTDRAQRAAENAPYVFITADEITASESSSGPRTLASDMDVTIEYALPTITTASPELVAHRGRADIVRALLAPLRGEPGGIRRISVTGSRITSAVEAGSSLVIAQVSARVGLSESKLPAS